jgi:outer membrane protein assembly factor BamB
MPAMPIGATDLGGHPSSSSPGRAGRRRRRPWVRAPAVAGVLLLALVSFACSGDGDDDEDARAAPSTTGAAEADEEGEAVETQAFVTRPDLTPPVIDVTVSSSTTPGLLFLAPKQAEAQSGPLIVDADGQVVWSQPTGEASATDFRVQTWRGEPVLTWYEGTSEDGHGHGEFVIADASYREIARVAAGNGLDGDLHEFQLTDAGTALILAYEPATADLTQVGGPAEGHVLDNYVQEVDVATGEVLFEWNAGEHVPISDTFSELVPDAAETDSPRDEDGSEDAPFDWFHVNSVAEGGDDTLIVSARNTHAVYAVDRTTGELRWTLGGKSSDFEMGAGTTFAWQHDARRLPDGTLTLFDNEAAPQVGDRSRALMIALDDTARTATLVREVAHPEDVLASTQGNVQVLPGGGIVVGWGSEGRVTEFDPAGQIVFDMSWAPADSYRVYRQPWTGRPTTAPDVVARPRGDGGAEVFASWNGATEVAGWRVLAGADEDEMTPVARVPRTGFETRVEIDADAGDAVAVEALDASGAVLGTSAPAQVAD